MPHLNPMEVYFTCKRSSRRLRANPSCRSANAALRPAKLC